MPLPADLKQILASGDFVLFLGSGYSKDCGLPLWEEALRAIAASLRGTDPARAALVEQDASRHRFLEAAETFYMAELTKADRFACLASVFDRPTITPTRRQRKLAALACQAIVTTNFDRVLPSASAAVHQDVVHFTENPQDLDAARLCQKKFTVRLHGRIESPDSIVFSKSHYAELSNQTAYVEFFREIFVHRNVIFFGFSFADPFLTRVITEMAKAVNSVFKRRAYAFLSWNPEAATQAILDNAAINVVRYDPKDEHKEAWDALCEQPAGVVPLSRETEKVDTLKREMAVIYARLKSRAFTAERIQVLAGLTLTILTRLPIGSTLSTKDWVQAVRHELVLPASIPERDIRDATIVLERDGFIRFDADGVRVVMLPDLTAVGEPLDKLVEGLVARSDLRYQHTVPPQARGSLRELISTTLAIDGLHVAHSVIRHRPLDDHRLAGTVERALALTTFGAPVNRQVVAMALTHLLTHPDSREEQLLAELSSVAFSTSLLIEDPVLALTYDPAKTMGVFADTNILLPWLCRGHPLADLYGGIIEAFGGSRVLVIPDYANEMVSHRRLALQTYREAGLEDPERLQRFVSLFEAHGVNTFIGGYAGLVAEGFKGTFEDYLAEIAPFETDSQAIAFLQTRGIATLDLTATERSRVREGGVLRTLRNAMLGRRSDIVIEHDACQIHKLMTMHALSEHAHFITADKLLIASIAQTEAQSILRSVWLPYQAMYLAQLTGAQIRPGLTRAMWMSAPDLSRRVQDYYIDRVLQQYETALLRSVPEIVDGTMAEIERIERKIGAIDDWDGGGNDRVKVFRALDRFEEGFYKKMLEAKKLSGIA